MSKSATNQPGICVPTDRDKLDKMGVSEEDIHQFFLNPIYSPRHWTIITTALDELTGVDNREAFLAVAREAPSEDMALFYQHVAEMTRGYHLHVGAGNRLLAMPRIPALYTKDRALVVMLPVDYLFWTSRVARVAQALTASVPSQPRIARRELWIAGMFRRVPGRNSKRWGGRCMSRYRPSSIHRPERCGHVMRNVCCGLESDPQESGRCRSRLTPSSRSYRGMRERHERSCENETYRSDQVTVGKSGRSFEPCTQM